MTPEAQVPLSEEEIEELEAWFSKTPGCQEIRLIADLKRARGALEEIANHKACLYENTEGGQYGIGVTDGHRLCSAIAKKGLGEADVPEDEIQQALNKDQLLRKQIELLEGVAEGLWLLCNVIPRSRINE